MRWSTFEETRIARILKEPRTGLAAADIACERAQFGAFSQSRSKYAKTHGWNVRQLQELEQLDALIKRVDANLGLENKLMIEGASKQ